MPRHIHGPCEGMLGSISVFFLLLSDLKIIEASCCLVEAIVNGRESIVYQVETFLSLTGTPP